MIQARVEAIARGVSRGVSAFASAICRLRSSVKSVLTPKPLLTLPFPSICCSNLHFFGRFALLLWGLSLLRSKGKPERFLAVGTLVFSSAGTGMYVEVDAHFPLKLFRAWRNLIEI